MGPLDRDCTVSSSSSPRKPFSPIPSARSRGRRGGGGREGGEEVRGSGREKGRE